ncbi:hypothetical protein B879_03119 [Cecembia lonarensis LW9]|uniref:Uncharacterized protein n=1 Tax=Cecembia lonarensis (strain CCUG 58316 / KCTC 22772 / LW9) TaxID=1225176 RepID=K1L0J4_CECL9|nr:hypothetical protein B879_03119 [Cecembia lonarensis LW9]
MKMDNLTKPKRGNLYLKQISDKDQCVSATVSTYKKLDVRSLNGQFGFLQFTIAL